MSKEIAKWIALLVLVILGAGACFTAGYMYNGFKAEVKHNDLVAKMNKRVDEIKDNQQANTIFVETEVVRVEKEIQVVYRDRIKEVVKYEQVAVDARDPIGIDWVLVHDALAAGTDPFDATTARVVDAAAQVTKADVLRVIAANYEAYQLCVARNDMWKLFYAKQEESFTQ